MAETATETDGLPVCRGKARGTPRHANHVDGSTRRPRPMAAARARLLAANRVRLHERPARNMAQIRNLPPPGRRAKGGAKRGPLRNDSLMLACVSDVPGAPLADMSSWSQQACEGAAPRACLQRKTAQGGGRKTTPWRGGGGGGGGREDDDGDGDGDGHSNSKSDNGGSHGDGEHADAGHGGGADGDDDDEGAERTRRALR
ncbi:hypothetical protein ACJQWK_05469 [Exserohilum turcicum]